LETDDETNDYVTVGPVHARDHGPGCSIAGVQNQPQGVQEIGLIVCSVRDITGGSELALPSELLEVLR